MEWCRPGLSAPGRFPPAVGTVGVALRLRESVPAVSPIYPGSHLFTGGAQLQLGQNVEPTTGPLTKGALQTGQYLPVGS